VTGLFKYFLLEYLLFAMKILVDDFLLLLLNLLFVEKNPLPLFLLA